MKKYKILFISSEVSPFAKTNILADFSYQLPLALSNLGHEVRVIIPKYKTINERKYVLREVIRLKDIKIPIGEEQKIVNVKSAFMPDSKVQIYFISYKPYFDREGLYINEKKKKEYPDNDERFILFSRGVLETLKLLFWQPDIIHCNDRYSGLIPVYLKTLYKNEKFFRKSSTIFTIHDFRETGCFNKSTAKKTGLTDDPVFDSSKTELNGKFSFLKSGISYSDFLCTNSKNYLKEIQNISDVASELSNTLKKNKDKIFSVEKGADYSNWNPENDKFINNQYNIKTIENKEENKKHLLKKAGLSFKPDTPLIGWVYSEYDSNFLEIIKDITKELEVLKIQIIIVGKFKRKLSSIFLKYKKLYSGYFSYISSDDEKSLHDVIAGCDMFILPYIYYLNELNPYYSLKYATMPIIRKIGEFSDIITEFNQKNNTGNGLIINNYNSSEILRRLKKAAAIFGNKKIWNAIQKNCMKEEFSWKNTAKKYMKIYSTALKNQK